MAEQQIRHANTCKEKTVKKINLVPKSSIFDKDKVGVFRWVGPSFMLLQLWLGLLKLDNHL
jgi:hypothetical protein